MATAALAALALNTLDLLNVRVNDLVAGRADEVGGDAAAHRATCGGVKVVVGVGDSWQSGIAGDWSGANEYALSGLLLGQRCLVGMMTVVDAKGRVEQCKVSSFHQGTVCSLHAILAVASCYCPKERQRASEIPQAW